VIHITNIVVGMTSTFKKLTESNWMNQNSPYDIWSVMQYGGFAFSNNGQSTITYKDKVKISARNLIFIIWSVSFFKIFSKVI
jgi:hypothetical protein